MTIKRKAGASDRFQEIMNALAADATQVDDVDMEFVAYLLEMSMFKAQEEQIDTDLKKPQIAKTHLLKSGFDLPDES